VAKNAGELPLSSVDCPKAAKGKLMYLYAWCLITLVTAALVLGTSFAHMLQIRPARRYGAKQWLEMQQHFYPSYAAAAGIIEPLAIVTAAVLAFVLRDWRPSMLTAIAGSACLAIAFVFVSLMVTTRINAQVSQWKAGALPVDWESSRRRLELAHILRLTLHLAGFALLVLATLISPLSDE
jgi:hypothetical protein